MQTGILESDLLKQISSLVLESDLYPEISPLEWISDLYYMHKRKWLYCSLKGSKLVAVAGAFRIPGWEEKYRSSMPEREEGSLLYLSFVASTEEIPVALPRLLKFCLRENPEVEEILYFKKKRGVAEGRPWTLRRRRVEKLSLNSNDSSEVAAESLVTTP